LIAVAVAVAVVTFGSSASFAQSAMTQRRACEPDVFRLCSSFIPNVGEIVSCLRNNEARLSDACHQVMFGSQGEPERYTPIRAQSDWNR
jgi:hypothetical protein